MPGPSEDTECAGDSNGTESMCLRGMWDKNIALTVEPRRVFLSTATRRNALNAGTSRVDLDMLTQRVSYAAAVTSLDDHSSLIEQNSSADADPAITPPPLTLGLATQFAIAVLCLFVMPPRSGKTSRMMICDR